jgi:hypothetical protein
VIASKPSSVAFHAELQSVGILNVFIGEGSERQLTRQPEPLERCVWGEGNGCSCWGKRGRARTRQFGFGIPAGAETSA